MRKLARSQMLSWKARHLQEVQGGLCPLCGLPIDLTIKGEGVIDHDHDTGQIRGVLHRSCNSAEGKVANAVGHWGSKSMKYSDIIPYLERMLAYLKAPATDFIYPMHKTVDEKREAMNLKRRTASAKVRAARKLKEHRNADS